MSLSKYLFWNLEYTPNLSEMLSSFSQNQDNFTYLKYKQTNKPNKIQNDFWIFTFLSENYFRKKLNLNPIKSILID